MNNIREAVGRKEVSEGLGGPAEAAEDCAAVPGGLPPGQPGAKERASILISRE